jgi:hypothetical protein
MQKGIIAVLALFLMVTALASCYSKPYEDKKEAPPAEAPKE